MNIFIAWLKSKNWTTKTVISGAIALAGYIAYDPSIQAWIKTTLASHPQLASLIILASIAYAKQSHSSSPAGTLATARQINATNPQTAEDVTAADTKAQ